MKGIWRIYKLCEFEVSADDCKIFLLISLELGQYKAPHDTLNLYHKKLNTRKQILMHLTHFILNFSTCIKMKQLKHHCFDMFIKIYFGISN